MKNTVLALAIASIFATTSYATTIDLGLYENFNPVTTPGPFSSGFGGVGDNTRDAGIPGYIGPDGDGVVSSKNYLNPIFSGWATSVEEYSPAVVSNNWKDFTNALGPVTGTHFDVVSLGEMTANQICDYLADPATAAVKPGTITLAFDAPIYNGTGADFVIFENSFPSTLPSGGVMVELAYVEVSTDGVHFARFPSLYLNTTENLDINFKSGTDVPEPIATGYLAQDPAYIYNLAGKHCNGNGQSWGTPFDLNDLLDHDMVVNGDVDLMNINYVRLVDIPGNGSFTDSLDNPIYDCWLTFDSGGFDLAGIGVIHQVQQPIASMDDIKFWVGEGPNRSVLAIDFQDGNDKSAFAWGFRWDPKNYGTNGPSGADMLMAIANADPNLTVNGRVLLNNVDFIFNISYKDTTTGKEHYGEHGMTPEYDFVSWSYFITGGKHTIYTNTTGGSGNPIGIEPVDGGGGNLPTPTEYTVSGSGLATRYLANGSWDIWVHCEKGANWEPLALPTAAIYAAQGIPQLPPPPPTKTFSVYETKISARTSIIREMKVNVRRLDDQGNLTNRNESRTVHYRAPLARAYTLLMTYDGNDLSMGWGILWSNDKRQSFDVNGESFASGGRDTDGEESFIGPRGFNIPEYGNFEFVNASEKKARIEFHGLATKDKNERIVSTAGNLFGENFFPIACTVRNCEAVEQRDQRDLLSLQSGQWIPNVYYPQAVSNLEGQTSPSHFFGTYTTRYNKRLSDSVTGQSDAFAAMEDIISKNNHIPERINKQ